MKELLVSLLGKPEGIVLFQLIMAARFTVLLSLLAFLGGGIVGAVVCTLRISPSKWLQGIGGAYVWLFQSTPLLMLLFIIGLGLPKFTGWDINPWTAAGLALTLYASAYLAEVWRAGAHVPAHSAADHRAASCTRRLGPDRRLHGADHQRHFARLHHRLP